MCGSIPGEEAGFGALLLRCGLEMCSLGPSYLDMGVGGGSKHCSGDSGVAQLKSKEKCVMKKELMKGKEVVSAEAGGCEMRARGFWHPGGLGACKKGGMLASWGTWAGTSLQTELCWGCSEGLRAPEKFCLGAAPSPCLMPCSGG